MFYPMRGLELAGGWVHGFESEPIPPYSGSSPRAVLENSLRDCLVREPCMVAFSGGRDSSALLAVAVHVARREGLSLPIPLTLRYADAPGSEESDWQQMVLDHLGLTDHVVITVGDEHDPIGPIAAPLLRRHGVVWPPNFTPTWRMMDTARGGVLITGECGDEVLGDRRITPVANQLRRLKTRRRPHRSLYGPALRALVPTLSRRSIVSASHAMRPWLREEPARILAERMVADERAFGMHAGRQTWQFVSRTGVRRMFETVQAFAVEIGVDYRAPFNEPDFAGALAHALGPWGWRSRTDAMTRLFGDVLPAAVLGRTQKAHFANAIWTEHTRAFARAWDGSGVDADVVDPDCLRENWMSEMPYLTGMGLLQQAWLASQSGPSTPAAAAPGVDSPPNTAPIGTIT